MTKFIISAITILLSMGAAQAQKPRLVVQIVVSSMRSGDLEHYAPNLSDGGFRRLQKGGAYLTQGHYDYQQTSTPVSLATITTGALPSTHGVIGTRWRDYVESAEVELIKSKSGITPSNLIAPTLGEALAAAEPDAKIVTIAADPVSSVVMAGKAGRAYWMDAMFCNWVTSSWYESPLPDWVQQFNRDRMNLAYLGGEWQTLLNRERYLNRKSFDITLQPLDKKGPRNNKKRKREYTFTDELDQMLYSPAGNTATINFAKQIITHNQLGRDATPDLLNICLDAPRRVSEAYGPESIEVEDMYYRLDRDLAELLTFLDAQVGEDNILIVLTSDHGTSPSYDAGREPQDRFNIRQFEVIINSFLNVRYGVGKWLLEYEDKCIYLDHNLIYEKGLDLAAVQNEVAIFAMQFRGVSHALSATAMRTSYFGSGYARRMQNSFYPRRSGDVILNFMPGWIAEAGRSRSSSGSLYGYDTNVPLIICGKGVAPQRIARTVDMTSVAPTIARLLEIGAPAASEGSVLEEILNNQK